MRIGTTKVGECEPGTECQSLPRRHILPRTPRASDHDRTNAADGRLIGSWCQVCGYLVPAEKRQPGAAPTCTGSKARTGRQHEPARMQALLIN